MDTDRYMGNDEASYRRTKEGGSEARILRLWTRKQIVARSFQRLTQGERP
jgi:hypothetical protein